jgi:hypothetical protein
MKKKGGHLGMGNRDAGTGSTAHVPSYAVRVKYACPPQSAWKMLTHRSPRGTCLPTAVRAVKVC